ncbi:SpaA isopeptide-forming pilin-related protein [Helcococcus bovis]|uniref:SpaA isopeptide-forming pilin-related protein n=1 Tax=Helcococcus bovis TaxID=3153252 RepID=UPI0038B7114B
MRIAKKTIALFLASLIFMLSIPLNVFANEQKISIWDSAVPIVIGRGQVEAKGELQGDTITWTIKASNVSIRNTKIDVRLSNNQTVEKQETKFGPKLNGRNLYYNFTLSSRAPSGEYKIITNTSKKNNDYTMTLTYNSPIGQTLKRTISLKSQSGQEAKYRGLISVDGYLSIEDKDGKAEKAICINTDKTFPTFSTKYPFEETTLDKLSSLIRSNNYNNVELIKKIKQAIYYAETNKESLLKGRIITGANAEKTLYYMIQGVIWRYTDNDTHYSTVNKHIINPLDQQKLKVAMDEIYSESQNVKPQDYERVNIRVFEPVNNAQFQNIISYKIGKRIIPYIVGAQFKLLKLEKGTSNRLPGAKFSLKNDSGTFNKEQIGNDKGEITFSNIPQGEYILKEEEAPTGYQKTDKTAKVIVDSQGDIKIDGSLIKKDPSAEGKYGLNVFVVENPRNSESPLGDFCINKTDKDTKRPLLGAEFILQSKNSNWSKKETSGNDGKIKFTGIPQGEYTLIETKSPDGYKKSNRQWQVYVNSAGRTFISELGFIIDKNENYLGDDLSENINLTGSMTTDENILNIGSGKDFININMNLKLNGKANPGDYFILEESDRLHYNFAQPDKMNYPSIYSSDGRVIAKPRFDINIDKGTNKKIYYVFTDYVTGADNLEMKLALNHAVNQNVAKNNGNYNFDVKIGQKSILQNYQVKYPDRNRSKGGYLNMDTSYSYTNDQNGKYTQLIYVNPDRRNLSNNTIVSVFPYAEAKYGFNMADIQSGKTKISIYKYIDSSKLSDAVIFEKDRLEKIDRGYKITFKEKGSWSYPNAGVEINLGTIGNTPYLIKVESDMKLPTTSSGQNVLIQYAALSNSNRSDSISKGNGIVTSSSSGQGAGTYTPPVLEVDNEKEKVKARFEILKTDNENKKLKDAVFSIKSVSKPQITVEKTSDNEGKVIFDNLKPDTYIIEETKAPYGYKKSNKKWKIVVDEKGNKKVFETISSDDNVKTNLFFIMEDSSKPISFNEHNNNAKYIYDQIKSIEGLKGKVFTINSGHGFNKKSTKYSEVEIGIDFNRPEKHTFGLYNSWLDEGFEKATEIINSNNLNEDRNIIFLIWDGKVDGSNFNKRFKELNDKNISSIYNLYSKEEAKNLRSSLDEIYNGQTEKRDEILDKLVEFKLQSPFNFVGKIKEDLSYISVDIKSNEPLKVKNEKEDIKYGKFTINKTDESDKPLDNAEFKLTKKMTYGNNENLPEGNKVKENFRDQIKNSIGGKVEFSNLPPGTYDLIETKSPDGYIKDQRKFVVVVQKDGNTFIVDADKYTPDKYKIEGNITKPNIDIDESKSRTSPMNLDGRIDVSGYKLYKKNQPFTTVDPSLGQVLFMDAILSFPQDVIEGDTFTVKLDKNLDMKGIALFDKTQKPFVYNGTEIASHIKTTIENGQYVFTYKMTDAVKNIKNIFAYMERPVFINADKVSEDTNLTFTNTIAGKEQSRSSEFAIRYTKYKSGEYNAVGNKFYFDKENNKLVLYVYASKYGISNPVIGINSEQIDFSNAKIKVFKTSGPLGGEGMPSSYGPDLMDLKNVVQSRINNNYDGSIDVIPLEDSTAYIVKVTDISLFDINYLSMKVTSSLKDSTNNPNPIVSYWRQAQLYSGNSAAEGQNLGHIRLLKVNEKNISLEGATFTLSKDDSSYSKTQTTLSDGSIVFAGLTNGYYTLTEKRAPKGYEKTNNTWKLYLTKNSDGTMHIQNTSSKLDNTEIIENNTKIKVINKKNQEKIYPEVTFKNFKNEITFYKVDEQGNSLEGASFKLFNNDKEVSGSEKSGSMIKYEKLSPGSYTVKEIKSPQGYTSPDNKIVATFMVNDNGQIVDVKTYNGTSLKESKDYIYRIVNKKEKKVFGKFEILKKSESFNGNTLENAEFTLYKDKDAKIPVKIVKDESENIIVVENTMGKNEDYTVKTDKQGKAYFVNLPEGSYYLKETKAPKGYILNSNFVWKVEVNSDGTVTISNEGTINNKENELFKLVKSKQAGNLQLIVVNKKPVYPSTGSYGSLPYMMTGIVLMSIAYIELKRNKKIYNFKGGEAD